MEFGSATSKYRTMCCCIVTVLAADQILPSFPLLLPSSLRSAKLENCILAAGSVVEEKSNLKDCDVAASVRVPSGTNSKGEKFDE